MSRNRVTGPGGYNAICGVCGFKFKASDLRRRWDGEWVCKWDWEPRHPQEFLRVKPDQTKLPFIRPDSDGVDVGPTFSCDAHTVEDYTAAAFLNLLSGWADSDDTVEVDIYKVRIIDGPLTIPDSPTVVVNCTLEIQ